jgi:hypothetical protein
MIREKDISDDVFDAMREDWRWLADAKFTKGSLAYALQLAIEHGLVSPPCWEVVGETLNTVTVFKKQEDAARWVEVDNGFRKCEMRHWKGQTES